MRKNAMSSKGIAFGEKYGKIFTPMGELEETSELRLDFTKLEKVGGQVAASRAAGAAPDPGVIPVAVQNADTKEVILVAYTNEFAMKESFAKRKLVLWSTSRNKLWFKGETSGETFDLLEAYVNCEQNSLLYVVRPCRGGICHTKNKAGAPRNCYYRRIDFDTLELKNLDP
jgi:phosphoribosyl-AMP cyclohydrolase